MNPYEVLGLKPNATIDDIKAAKRRAASAAHPDRAGGSEERMAEVNEVYAILSDERRRAVYDATGATDSAKTPQTMALETAATLMQKAMATQEVDLIHAAKCLLKAELMACARGSREAAACKELTQLRMRKIQRKLEAVQANPDGDFLTRMLEAEIARADEFIHKMFVLQEQLRLAEKYFDEYESTGGDSGDLYRALSMPGTWRTL